jgi:hypothetical protein
MTAPFGGSIPNEITLTRDEARDVLFALDDAIEAVPPGSLRVRVEQAARLIVEKLMPDLPDL